MPADVNTAWGRVLADELARCGLRHAVIAPGSRSTPLVLALAAHPDVEDHSVLDERAAAFLALGIARATGAPTAVVTTSGTAAANLLPAVVEADRAGVALLLLTSDRPPELRDAGDSQAADQVKLFGERVRWFHGVAEPSLDDGRLAYLRSTACEAWSRALGTGGPPGPVHLDLPFRKPLAPGGGGSGAEGDDAATGPGAAGREGGSPWRRVAPARLAPDPALVEELALALAGAARPLVLAGALHPAEVDPPGLPGTGLRPALERLLRVLPVPVWAEATSCLGRRGGAAGSEPGSGETGVAPSDGAGPEGVPAGDAGRAPGAVLGSADLLLQGEGFRRALEEERRPDLVVRLGEAPLPWSLRGFVGTLAAHGVTQWAVDPWGRRRDPEHAVSRTAAAEPARLLAAVADWLEEHRPPRAADPEWLPWHVAADRAARKALARRASAIEEAFDGGVFAGLGAVLPEDAALVVSSSMPLRELETFLPASGSPSDHGPPDVFANRGVNGIDGVIATAAGVALGRRAAGESRTLLVTGDVAFAHDLSGALAAGRLGSDLVTVLVDNGGGAIFDHLPGVAADPAFERHFITAPGIDFAGVARGLGWECAVPETREAFEEAVEAALAGSREGPRLIHVRTDRHRSREIRREILETVGRAVDEAVLGGHATVAGEATGDSGAPAPSTSARPAGSPARSTSARAADAPAEAGRPRPAPTPVLLLHGFTGSGAGLGELVGPLEAAGHPVLAPDLPGHGGAPVPAGGLTLEAAVTAVLDALERRGVSRAHWVGYSMGGRVALAATLEHPERVASLTLIGASPGIEDPSARAERRAADEELARRIERDGLAAFVDAWMAQPLFASQARLGHRRLRAARVERLAGTARGYAAALRGLGQGTQPSLWERFGELEIPVLLVAGTGDTKYVDLTRRMAERIPDARVDLVPDAGHAAWLEAPGRVGRLLLDFWGPRVHSPPHGGTDQESSWR